MRNRFSTMPVPSDHSFDPAWLIDVMHREKCDPAAIEAVRSCTRFLHGETWQLYFVNNENANQPGAEWQFAGNIVLYDTPYGLVVLDVLKDGRIGSIEFVDEVSAALTDGRLS